MKHFGVGYLLTLMTFTSAQAAAPLVKKLPAKRFPAQAVTEPSEVAPVVVASKLPETLNRETVYLLFKEELEKSLTKTVQDRVAKTVKIENAMSRAIDPWTLSSSLKMSESEVTPKFQDITSTTTLKYSTPRGFAFSSYFDLYENSAFAANAATRNSHSNMGFSISQDLFSLGGKTVFDYNIKITEMQSRAKLVAADDAYLSEVLKVVDNSFGLFGALCRKQDLEFTMKLAEETAHIAEVQAAAKTIGTKDFLRVNETVLGLQRQKLVNLHDIESYQRQFGNISAAAKALAEQISKQKVVCESDLDAISKTKVPSRDELRDLVAKSPSLLNIEISKDLAKKRFEAYRKQRHSTLQVSTGLDQINNIGPYPPYAQVYVGLVYTYQFQGQQFDLNKQSTQEQLNDLTVKQQQTTMTTMNYIMGFYDDLESYLGQVDVAKKSLENSSKLLRTLQAQQSIGQLDATAIESGFFAYSNAIADRRDLFSRAAMISIKLNEIKAATQKLQEQNEAK